jgi:hypothetical protein
MQTNLQQSPGTVEKDYEWVWENFKVRSKFRNLILIIVLQAYRYVKLTTFYILNVSYLHRFMMSQYDKYLPSCIHALLAI